MSSANAYINGEDILVVTCGFWDTAQRIRHKMPSRWARNGCRVLWIEQSPFPPQDWTRTRLSRSVRGELREVEPRLFVGAMPPAVPGMYRSGTRGEAAKALQAPLYYRRLKAYLRTLDFNPKWTVLFQQAARRDVFSLFPDSIRVYYHHDVYGFGHATPEMQDALVACCKSADMVWCVAKEHRDELIRYNRDTHFLPHAVDEAWYRENRGRIPEVYASIPKPRAVYTGVFQEKIDLQLLIDTATARPGWSFVFVGPVEPKNLDTCLIDILERLPNVHFVGARDVDELPGFMAGATVLMLPYAPTENMKSAGLSLKFFEYLISGKPLLVAPYTDFQISDELFYLADGPFQWVDALDRLAQGDDETLRDRRIATARENSYDARIDTQRALLADAAARRFGTAVR